MEEVQPIRRKEDIDRVKEALKHKPRNLLLFTVGVNTGLRVSDLLRLKASHVLNKTRINIKEKKTGKLKKFFIDSQLRNIIMDYIEENQLQPDDYLFQSQKGNNKPISRIQAYRILKSACERLNIEDVGTHTLRKTFGYHHYQRNKDVATLQKLFNHSSPQITLRYIGIDQDLMDESIRGFFL